MAKYKITITNNETREEVFNLEGNAIVAAAAVGSAAATFFVPGEEDESIALVSSVEDGFAGMLGGDVDDAEEKA